MKNNAILSCIAMLGVSVIIIYYVVFSFVTRCDHAFLTLTFDDGYLDTYTKAYPILQKYDMVGTTAIIAGRVGNTFEEQNLMSWEQIKNLQDKGWEITSHTTTHPNLTELSEGQITTELVGSKGLLLSHGLVTKSLTIPYGQYNDVIKEVAKKQYETARSSKWGANNLSEYDPYDLQSYWVVNTTSLDEMKQWVSDTVDSKTWAIVMFHHVRDDTGREYTITPQQLSDFLAFVKKQDIRVKTISGVHGLSCQKT